MKIVLVFFSVFRLKLIWGIHVFSSMRFDWSPIEMFIVCLHKQKSIYIQFIYLDISADRWTFSATRFQLRNYFETVETFEISKIFEIIFEIISNFFDEIMKSLKIWAQFSTQNGTKLAFKSKNQVSLYSSTVQKWKLFN